MEELAISTLHIAQTLTFRKHGMGMAGPSVAGSSVVNDLRTHTPTTIPIPSSCHHAHHVPPSEKHPTPQPLSNPFDDGMKNLEAF